MVLLKHEENGSIECLYDSTNILGSKYVVSERKLAIIFDSGRQYIYEGVKLEDYIKFEGDVSQGKMLHRVIKKYSYSQAKQLVDVQPLVEQIEEIRKTL
tara:strand:+ start:123 stop:419 length:297 start_codon:yes stop_codon:yes gene_type:complete